MFEKALVEHETVDLNEALRLGDVVVEGPESLSAGAFVDEDVTRARELAVITLEVTSGRDREGSVADSRPSGDPRNLLLAAVAQA